MKKFWGIFRQLLRLIKLIILTCVIILPVWIIIEFNDLYPNHIYYRYKLANFIKSGQKEIYLRDLVSFKFRDVYFIYSYDDLIYDERCGLENTVAPNDGNWGIAYVTEDCDSYKIMLTGTIFSYGRSNHGDKGSDTRRLSYDDAKIRIMNNNSPNMKYPYCYDRSETCLVLDY
ncbi:MAG: hypothetical protein AABY33_02760 [Pseudomonadota bacterium]